MQISEITFSTSLLVSQSLLSPQSYPREQEFAVSPWFLPAPHSWFHSWFHRSNSVGLTTWTPRCLTVKEAESLPASRCLSGAVGPTRESSKELFVLFPYRLANLLRTKQCMNSTFHNHPSRTLGLSWNLKEAQQFQANMKIKVLSKHRVLRWKRLYLGI